MNERNVKLTRRNAIKMPTKRHTSIYLLPRHIHHLQFLMNARGTSMTDCINWLIDQSIRTYQQSSK